MRLMMGLLALSAISAATAAFAVEEGAPARPRPGTIGMVTLLECDGSGIRELAIRSTSGVGGSLMRAHLDLTNGESESYSVRRLVPPRGRAGGATVYKGTDFELSISLTSAPDRDGRRTGSLKAKISGKKLDQSVSCKR